MGIAKQGGADTSVPFGKTRLSSEGKSKVRSGGAEDIVERLREPHYIADEDHARTPDRVLDLVQITLRSERYEAAAEITRLRELLHISPASEDAMPKLLAKVTDMHRAFRRIAQGCSAKAAKEIASSWADEPLCATHGTPFISPGLCPFCDEASRLESTSNEH